MIDEYEIEYRVLLRSVLKLGERRQDRTGTGTRSSFGVSMIFDMDVYEGFPLITGKKIHWNSVLHELLWFISGDTNVKYLHDHGVHIWDEWADEDGDLGRIYGAQWRGFRGLWDVGKAGASLWTVDQLAEAVRIITAEPESRRILVSAWNPVEIPLMALPPCHVLFQFYVRGGEFLDLQLYQRSGDLFLGVPFNIASYALLLSMVAYVTDLRPGRFTHVLGDAHIYENHVEQVEKYLNLPTFPAPRVRIDGPKDLFRLRAEHIHLENYQHGPVIKAPVAV